MPDPGRGEVWLTDLGFAAKVGPCLFLSIPPLERGRALVIPHTTSVRGSRFEIGNSLSFLREGAFDVQSLVTVPFPKLIRRPGTLSPSQLEQVAGGVLHWLGVGRYEPVAHPLEAAARAGTWEAALVCRW